VVCLKISLDVCVHWAYTQEVALLDGHKSRG